MEEPSALGATTPRGVQIPRTRVFRHGVTALAQRKRTSIRDSFSNRCFAVQYAPPDRSRTGANAVPPLKLALYQAGAADAADGNTAADASSTTSAVATAAAAAAAAALGPDGTLGSSARSCETSASLLSDAPSFASLTDSVDTVTFLTAKQLHAVHRRGGRTRGAFDRYTSIVRGDVLTAR